MNKARLDQFVLDIEFLLISVVQGVALAALATSSAPILASLNLEYFPYIFSAFLMILIFWSGAITHCLSFIDWPLDLTHNFLYFLLAFIEVMAFSQISNPFLWFAFLSLFFIVAIVLYQFDMKLIKDHQKEFESSDSRKKLYEHILKEQFLEGRVLLPIGFIFQIIAVVIVFNNPSFHLILGIIDSVIISGFLINFMSGFKKRAKFISETLR